ncbi:hypothetical protein AT05_11755 [Schleiferia thermophila str. Yellowstone]|uniref:helix-turn-helix domain-containing protein n=1 Tax=Schleiferia thermophila TaxID=884107 RepID=UPI0004E776A3|nr:hypothetical protein AT05_11755 [Schleiferia thermophila str. Yellowstone]
MDSFGKRLRACREDKGLSQQVIAKQLNTSHSEIGRYERDEMSPSVEVARKMATLWILLWGIYWVKSASKTPSRIR